jgi:hypothetical protein
MALAGSVFWQISQSKSLFRGRADEKQKFKLFGRY